MNRFSSYGWIFTKLAMSCLAACGSAQGQLLNQDQVIEVRDLPSLMARSPHSADVLLTSLDTIFHDREVCCGKDSALEDRALTADPLSLGEVASKIRGKWTLSDNRRILITADFLPAAPSGDISFRIVGKLRDKHAILMVWNSHIYVFYGAVFDEVGSDDGGSSYMIHKLFLLDPRYSGARREVTFNRDTDDWSKVAGLLLVTVAEQ